MRKPYYLIIGGGVAGLEAAKAIRKADPEKPLAIISKENHCPYSRPGLSQILATGAQFDSLLLEKETYYPEHAIDLLRGKEAVSIDAWKKQVMLSDGSALPYARLLLATGANPFNPIKAEPDGIPVKVLRRYEDAIDLFSQARGRRVLLVGGGILGLEAAESLHKIGAQVTVVEYTHRILPLQTDETASALLAQKLEAMGISLIFNHSALKVLPGGAELDDGSVVPADMVLASMGVRSEVGLAASIGLALNRGIVVDENMRTSHADIWAAGDCAEFDGRVQAMAGAARLMGAAAGASMAGQDDKPYHPFAPATMFRVDDFSLFSAGNVSAEPEEELVRQDGPLYRRLFFMDGRLTGALFIGKYPAGKIMQALAQGLPKEQAAPLLDA